MCPGPIIYGALGEHVAGLRGSSLDADETLANARLISCAPEMLDALEGILEWWFQSENDGDDSPLFENARAIISKAKGEE
jgi:hypothetical protein